MPLYKRIFETRRRLLGAEHPDTLMSSSGLASAYLNEGDYKQAAPLLTNALEIQKRVLGEDHPDTLTSMTVMAQLYVSQGKYAQAGLLESKVLEVRRRVLGEQHPSTVDAMASLGEIRLRQHNYIDAEPLLRDVLKIQQGSKPDSWKRYFVQNLLGASLAGQKKYADAEPLLVSGYIGMKQREATIPSARRHVLDEAGERVVKLYEAWANQEKASEWHARLRDSRSAASEVNQALH